MGHVHSRPADGRPGARHHRRLVLAFGLIAGFFVVELAYAMIAGSLALLSDAGHMAADVVALGAALIATRIAGRPDPTGRRTYGSYRAEVFASGLSVLLMLGVAAYVAIEAIGRLGDGPQVAATPMLVVGAAGLVVNLVALLVLRAGAAESLNVKGAYLEVVADTVGSAGVIVAGVLVAATGQAIWDTLIALAIGGFVVVRAIALGRQVFAVLAQHAPEGMNIEAVVADLAAVEGVKDVHDLHLWTLTSGMHVATAHLVTSEHSDGHVVLDRSRRLLRERHGVTHATLQVETARHIGCNELGW